MKIVTVVHLIVTFSRRRRSATSSFRPRRFPRRTSVRPVAQRSIDASNSSKRIFCRFFFSRRRFFSSSALRFGSGCTNTKFFTRSNETNQCRWKNSLNVVRRRRFRFLSRLRKQFVRPQLSVDRCQAPSANVQLIHCLLFNVVTDHISVDLLLVVVLHLFTFFFEFTHLMMMIITPRDTPSFFSRFCLL